MIMRHESKHILHYADRLLLSHRLSKLFPHDAHAGAQGEYRVRSLYFDTPGDHALREKIDGVAQREKFRLRLYDGDASYIRLEKKIKRNGLCAKKSAVISREKAELLLSGDFLWLQESGDPLLIELYSHMQGRLLRPKTVVEYIREPFVYPAGNVRVTLDRDIRSGLTGTVFFDPNMPLLPTFEAHAVMEIKYDHFIPDLVAQAVWIPNRRQTAFSKYAVCRKYD